MMRQVVLDTETTGLDPKRGHRVIEIGCVELVHRRLTGRHFHIYVQPERAVDKGAFSVHGISNEFLADKPKFIEVVEPFLSFIEGSELIIHNAPFDVGFLNHELKRLTPKPKQIDKRCKIIDTLALARRLHPGQRNNLDALCKRYGVDNSNRELHGALLDAEILARLYLFMTGGQDTLFEDGQVETLAREETMNKQSVQREPLPVIAATPQERSEHQAMLETMEAASKKKPLWEVDE